MRILFLSQILPYPLDAGPKVRAYYVLRHLAARHDVILLSFVRASDTEEAIAHLESFCERVITIPIQRSLQQNVLALAESFFTQQPFLILRDREQAMKRQVEQLISEENLDFVHADQLWMAPYGLLNSNGSEDSPQHVLDQHNAVFRIPERMAEGNSNPLVRWLLKREANLMRSFEQETCSQYDEVVWVTNEDRKAVLNGKAIDTKEKSIIPICIDTAEVQAQNKLTDQASMLFLGGMHWPPNAEGVRWFVEQVHPVVRQQVPDAELHLVGKQPPVDDQPEKGVRAWGYADDLETHWRNSRVFIVPLHAGGGMRVKILDAWAKGIPIVSTTIGAEGLAYEHEKNILIADSPEEFAQATIRLLRDDKFAKKLANAGRKTVENHYDWQKIYAQWDTIYG